MGSIIAPVIPGLISKVPLICEYIAKGLEVLLAVPYSKHNRRYTRRKFFLQVPKLISNVTKCKVCGKPKLVNNVCPGCFQRYMDEVSPKKKDESDTL
ncbi:hypothetical protein ROZALSC1DRAFT_29595 [Rozella allomycis CSF55]|uniref:50S ribosomal protein L32 n=1 Tax=Rozella allomycis (strain CSF55) TaxID=988480 RepID=A0A075B1N9_ROZAC|nr:hypothetical protein O9G_002767 [Rozella allomycis CSF55]RKP18747.1 hypothetical protein ROZALSC1DRAFT_29595 [Rozella allomycis CSF55]|eukprot:EPZ34703.1 hypothetical protein O9G_002767 [Rozella allomycis CSF55]